MGAASGAYLIYEELVVKEAKKRLHLSVIHFNKCTEDDVLDNNCD